jgi:type II secretion system protein J
VTHSSRHHSPPLGFTLLEMLVAMLMMVSIASCLYTALSTGFRAYHAAQQAVGPTSQAIDAIELLKQDIDGVLPPGGVLAGAFIGTNEIGMKGVDTDSLEFYTTHVYASDEQITGGIDKIELLLEDNAEGGYGTYMLVRRVTANLLPPKDVEPEEQILCRNVASLNLRYFDGDNWVDDWDSTNDANSLPLAVEMDIEILQNDEKSRTVNEDIPRRRLVQSFTIPCKAAAAEEESYSTP